ncbi:MAG: hypothetical protein AAB697_03150 [Patescibacteria group bacterium]
MKKAKNIFIILLFFLSALDIDRINTRRGYYPHAVGRIFQNKVTESFTIIRKKAFSLFYF